MHGRSLLPALGRIEGDDAEQGFQMSLIRRAVREASLTFDVLWHGFDRFLDVR